MKRTFLIVITWLISSSMALAASEADSSFKEVSIILHTQTGDIFGTLTTPKQVAVVPIAVIISGSGPTDRNGNSMLTRNDGLKQLAYAMAENGVASVRFDKRGIAASFAAGKKEAGLRFENYISDVEEWVSLLRTDKRFSEIIIAGHSEGSLVGMIAAGKADKFISIAGAGQSADLILKEQLSGQPLAEKQKAFMILDSLKAGNMVIDHTVNAALNSIFSKNLQPYLISWFKYDPQTEIKKLTIPVLILQGTNDLQVTTADAQRLATADPKAALVLIKNMNHVLKIVGNSQAENLATYQDPSLPISTALITAIIDFIKAN